MKKIIAALFLLSVLFTTEAGQVNIAPSGSGTYTLTIGLTGTLGTAAYLSASAVAASGSNSDITGLSPGGDFYLLQNSVKVFESKNTSAVVDTLYINGGNVGVRTTSPLALLSVGSGSLSDANVPIQINAGSSSEADIGVNKGGGYGALIGLRNSTNAYGSVGPLYFWRSVSGDPVGIPFDSTGLVFLATSTRVGIGGIITSTAMAGANLVVTGSSAVVNSALTLAGGTGAQLIISGTSYYFHSATGTFTTTSPSN